MNNRGLLDLVISILPGLMPQERVALAVGFDCERDLFVQSKEDLEKYLNRCLKYKWDFDESRAKAEKIDKICRLRSIQRVSLSDESYPPLLREIHNPPVVLYFIGRLADPEKPLLGMVGTRKPGADAATQAYDIARDMGRAGVSVISGLALGIDSASHRGNIASGIPGYAVLGSGIDEVYPSSNKILAKKILENSGAIISEYSPGTPPDKWRFPERNRIIAALSRGVLIVQAPKKSGALITAYMALDQGKDVWVASSGIKKQGIFDIRGTEKLESEGAQVVYSARDILERWNIQPQEIENNENGSDIISSMANYLEVEI